MIPPLRSGIVRRCFGRDDNLGVGTSRVGASKTLVNEGTRVVRLTCCGIPPLRSGIVRRCFGRDDNLGVGASRVGASKTTANQGTRFGAAYVLRDPSTA